MSSAGGVVFLRNKHLSYIVIIIKEEIDRW